MLLPQTFMNESGDAAGPARGALGVAARPHRRPARRDRPPLRRGPQQAGRRRRRPQRPQEPRARPRRRDFWRVRVGVGRPDSHRPRDRLRPRARPLQRAPRARSRPCSTGAADEAERLVERIAAGDAAADGRGGAGVERAADPLRGRRRRGRPAAPRPPRGPQRDQHRDARGDARPPRRRPRPTTSVRVLVDLLDRPHGPLGRRRRPRGPRQDGPIRRMQLFADLYDELTAFPKPTIAACHGAVRRRRRRDRGRLRPPRRRLEPADALPRRRARRAGRPGPPRHPLRALGRQVPAADLEGDRRRRGAPLGPRPQGRARGRDRGGRRSSSPRRSPPTRPSRSARIKGMLHDWDGVVERSRAEGEGQVAWQRTGPGLPHRD